MSEIPLEELLEKAKERPAVYFPAVFARLRDAEAERDAAQRECDEQARLLGMGGEREARLMVERDAMKAALQRLYEADMAARNGDNGWRWQDAMRAAEAALAGGRK